MKAPSKKLLIPSLAAFLTAAALVLHSRHPGRLQAVEEMSPAHSPGAFSGRAGPARLDPNRNSPLQAALARKPNHAPILIRLAEMARDGRSYVICGDWNIAHRKIDIKNWRGNQKNSGFLPEERAWMDELFGEVGMADAFRAVDSREEQYTWWSNRGRAWDNNTGWRIDYQVTTPDLAGRANRVEIYKDERFSDHAPLIMDYDYELPSRG